MWVIHCGLLLRLPWRTWVAPVRARCGGGAAALVAEVLAALVVRGVGSWGSRKYRALEDYGNQYWPVRSSIPAWRTPSLIESWQATVYRVAKVWTLLKQPYVHRHKTLFFSVSPLPQWDLSVKVAQLLGLWGPWQRQVCRDCLCCKSYSPIWVFFQASCNGDQKTSLASLSP